MASLHKENLLVGDLQLLFPPALIPLTKQHRLFEGNIKQRLKESNHVVGEIGDLLLAMFHGQSGEDLKQLATQFSARQRITLESLKNHRSKNKNLQRVLAKVEANKSCRRLQLKDLLPAELQRLTKYPLLFENLLRVTVRVAPEKGKEADAIRLALKNSRDILNHVNVAVKEAEDVLKLQSIQRKLDKSMFDRELGNSEFKNIDLTKHKLVHSGLLLLEKNATVQFEGLLFENLMVLLQKQQDNYLIKSYNKMRLFPVIKMAAISVFPSAVDTQTFFVINRGHPQMLQLTAPSANECEAWLKLILENSKTLSSLNRSHGEEAGNVAPVRNSEPSESEKLRRIDELIKNKLAEKQQIICNMLRVPMDDFNTTEDIVGQPEALQEPSDLILVVSSHIQSLIAKLNEHLRFTPYAEVCQEQAAASSKDSQPMLGLSLADDCHWAAGDAATVTLANIKTDLQQQTLMHEDGHGCCEQEKQSRDQEQRQ